MFPFVCSSRLDLKSSGFQDTKIPEKLDSDEKAGQYLGADATTCSNRPAAARPCLRHRPLRAAHYRVARGRTRVHRIVVRCARVLGELLD